MGASLTGPRARERSRVSPSPPFGLRPLARSCSFLRLAEDGRAELRFSGCHLAVALRTPLARRFVSPARGCLSDEFTFRLALNENAAGCGRPDHGGAPARLRVGRISAHHRKRRRQRFWLPAIRLTKPRIAIRPIPDSFASRSLPHILWPAPPEHDNAAISEPAKDACSVTRRVVCRSPLHQCPSALGIEARRAATLGAVRSTKARPRRGNAHTGAT